MNTKEIEKYAPAVRLVMGLNVETFEELGDAILNTSSWWAGTLLRGGEVNRVAWSMFPTTERGSVLWESHGSAIMLCASVDELPTIGAAVFGLWGGSEETWRDTRSQWSETESGLSAWNIALGGDGDVSAFASVLHDDRLAEGRLSTSNLDKRKAAIELLRRIHRDPQALRYVEYLEELLREPKMPVPDGLGMWRRAALSAFLASTEWEKQSYRQVPMELLWEFWCGPYPLEGGADWLLNPLQPHGSSLLLTQTARALEMRSSEALAEWRDYPLWRVLSHVDRIHAYDGFAHMAAAAELDIGGQPVDAWNALATASLFLGRRLGQVPKAVRNAARTIAKRPGWEPMGSALGAMEPDDD